MIPSHIMSVQGSFTKAIITDPYCGWQGINCEVYLRKLSIVGELCYVLCLPGHVQFVHAERDEGNLRMTASLYVRLS